MGVIRVVITFLPLVVLALQQQQQVAGSNGVVSFMQQAIGTPTGKNGYEEYVAAAEITESPAYVQFEAYTPPSNAKPDETLLAAWREQVRRFAPVGEFIFQGNAKPVYDPRPRTSGKGAPELAGFPGVADFFARSAYVSLSNGDPQTAERTLEAGLQFVCNIDDGTEVSGKAASTSADHVFKAIAADAPRFGVRELDRLADAVGTLLAEDPSPLNSLRAIRRADVATAERALRDPRSAGAMATAIQSLTQAQRERTLRQFVADEDSYLQMVINTASQPEAKWEKVPFQESDPVAAGLARSSIAANIGPLQNVAKLRTKLRIVRLMARGYHYQWQFNRLPATLAMAAKSAELSDPLSGVAFELSLKEGTIEIDSAGSDWTGPIRLLNKTQAGD